ncbi:Ppx/GppA phosphatase family protein [Microlunatus panaciterrae]|uniref:Exopolyphosphatase/guanosine-5'-triphosphate, 3'-diphosphate pyrophosphatase n=1 Tax=Microlunatus panaciterrae TaxID=400768 RepID=A0ABS2RHP3_9ACTN|nr:Ppx/GppA phosphatase family protein [Microlunatus panaciterrae]MBM7798052.1 exopolyphosphatase/guanosine-5'-triphosphate,3'-diphosphate pyrophosphatase [Microlunatus panaciterrae]
MNRVAAIDCGTNSIRLLVAEADENGKLVELDRRLEMVRLGQGVDAAGEFHPDALGRTFAAADHYAQAVSDHRVDPDRVRFVATSAARDARNRDEFFAGIQRRLGVLPEVISGEEEAKLSFTGALSGLAPEAEPVLVMDIGGGSTELITGTVRGEIDAAQSLDIGSVRITERFLPGDPASAADRATATAYIDGLLDEAVVELHGVATWIGVAGTATTLAAMHLGLAVYERERVHGATIPTQAVLALAEQLSGMTVEQIRAVPSMHPKRADVITAGALIAARIASRVGAEQLVVSESDILDGIALQLLST